jgi:hypothetical protein
VAVHYVRVGGLSSQEGERLPGADDELIDASATVLDVDGDGVRELLVGTRVLGWSRVPLAFADAPYDADAASAEPCATSWVLVLGEGPPRHAQLGSVAVGSQVAFAGRLLEVGDGV